MLFQSDFYRCSVWLLQSEEHGILINCISNLIFYPYTLSHIKCLRFSTGGKRLTREFAHCDHILLFFGH